MFVFFWRCIGSIIPMTFILSCVAIISVFLRSYPLCSVLFGIVLMVISALFFVGKNRAQKVLANFFFTLGFYFIFFHIFFGHLVSNWIIKNAGIEVDGIITKTESTSTLYNDEMVEKFIVTLKDTSGNIYNTESYSDDFNVVGGDDWNSTTYPHSGQQFHARMLANYPRAYVILTDTDSEYGKSIQSSKDIESLKFR